MPAVEAAIALVLAVATPTAAQVTWRARAIDEITSTRANTTSPFAPATPDLWTAANDLLAAGDLLWDASSRVRIGAAALLRARQPGDVRARAREAYVRLAPASWIDLEAGKRLARWGTGYAFSPTGLLDPPRDPTDPTDRLAAQEGIVALRADLFRGPTAFSLAVAAPGIDRPPSGPQATGGRLVAARLRTTVAGADVAAVVSAGDGRTPSWGGNVTYVVGRRFEVHGEALVHDVRSPWRTLLDGGHGGGRTMSAVIGGQYTFDRGINIVVELYRDGNGLTTDGWSRLIAGARPGAPLPNASRPTRQTFLFARASSADIDARLVPEVLIIAGLDDGSVTSVAGLSARLSTRLQAYVRATSLDGPAWSADGSAPVAATITAGIAARF